MFLVKEVILFNQITVRINNTIGHPDLEYERRIKSFNEVQAILERPLEKTFPLLAENLAAEYEAIVQAKEFLDASEYNLSYEPTIQLLSNPDFDYDKIGWIEYSSVWQSQQIVAAGKDRSVVSFSREGEGHSSISQILSLKSGQCYLWSVTGFVTREDQISTFWLYWETYETGQPNGNNLISNTGEQPLQRYNGVFCLNQDEAYFQRVVVAPVSIYGNATVFLDSARLYELRILNER